MRTRSSSLFSLTPSRLPLAFLLFLLASFLFPLTPSHAAATNLPVAVVGALSVSNATGLIKAPVTPAQFRSANDLAQASSLTGSVGSLTALIHAGDLANSNHVASATGAVALALSGQISAAATKGSNYADEVEGFCRNAANLTNSVPKAALTNAFAQWRAPQSVTYTGTNVWTDARLGSMFRVYVTNDFRLHAPTGPADGQFFKYWFVQWKGGTNTITTVASEFLPPEGSSGMPVLAVSNLWNDVWLGTWDARINKVRIESFMSYRE